MLLEELVVVSIPIAHESSDAIEIGFVAADPRARPEEIVEGQLGDCATVLPTEVEAHPPIFGLARWGVHLGVVHVDRARAKHLANDVKRGGDAGRYFSFREAGTLTAQIADGVRA